MASAVKRKGVPLSKEVKIKLSLSCKGRGVVPIIMLNKDGILIKTFESVLSAAKETGLRQSNISNVLTKRAKTAGGYIWQYLQIN
jgi:hypothetical protein